MLCPETLGLGSTIAKKTSFISAAISASTQGGVLPLCVQGSREMYAVAPLVSSFAFLIALISA